MLTRRGFFGFSGIGVLTLSAGCTPPAWQQSASADELSSSATGLARKAHLQRSKNYLLGYPINMNTPADGFFRWRAELQKVGLDTFAFNNVGNPFKQGNRTLISFRSKDCVAFA
jgi:histidine decarboxylase